MPLQTFYNLPEEKRQKIIDCAIKEFASNDFESASVSRIVTKVGIAKGSFYQYFRNKSDLYFFLLEQATQKKAEIMSRSFQQNSESSLFVSLRQLFTSLSKFEVLYPELSRIGYRAATGKSPLPEETLIKARMATQQYFVEMIERGRARGEVRLNINVNAVAFLLTTALAELGNYIGIVPDEIGRSEQDISSESRLFETYKDILGIIQDGIANK